MSSLLGGAEGDSPADAHRMGHPACSSGMTRPQIRAKSCSFRPSTVGGLPAGLELASWEIPPVCLDFPPSYVRGEEIAPVLGIL